MNLQTIKSCMGNTTKGFPPPNFAPGHFSKYFRWLDDDKLAMEILEAGGGGKEESRHITNSWRKLATDVDHEGSISLLVKKGFNMDGEEFQLSSLKRRPPSQTTTDMLVFCIPTLFTNMHCPKFGLDTEKNVLFSFKEMDSETREVVYVDLKRAPENAKELLSVIRKEYNLPSHHLTRFGSIELLTGILFSLGFTKKNPVRRIFPNIMFLVDKPSDSSSDGDHYLVGFDGLGRLSTWNLQIACVFSLESFVSCFPLGIENIAF
jgi:hypothetical protein